MSTNVFKASNGIEVRLDSAVCGDDHITAAAEYFQHRRDEELGRWRNPDRPNEVVYPQEDGDIWVFDEAICRRLSWSREQAEDDEYSPGFGFDTARAYFAAHPPEPKPWEEAETGEVWILTRWGTEEPFLVTGGKFIASDLAVIVDLDSDSITAGRRIWPAEADGSLAVLDRIREAVKGHPECDVHPDGDPISCGWKSAYSDVVAALKEGDDQ